MGSKGTNSAFVKAISRVKSVKAELSWLFSCCAVLERWDPTPTKSSTATVRNNFVRINHPFILGLSRTLNSPPKHIKMSVYKHGRGITAIHNSEALSIALQTKLMHHFMRCSFYIHVGIRKSRPIPQCFNKDQRSVSAPRNTGRICYIISQPICRSDTPGGEFRVRIKVFYRVGLVSDLNVNHPEIIALVRPGIPPKTNLVLNYG